MADKWDERQLLTDEIEDGFRIGDYDDDASQFNYYEIDHLNQRVVKRSGATIIGGMSDKNFGGDRTMKSSMSIITASNPFKLAQPLSPSRYDEPDEEYSENEHLTDKNKLESEKDHETQNLP